MELISPLDSMFLLGESREHPMHVGGLQLFEPPKAAGPEFLREIYQDLITREDVVPTFRKHPAELLGGIANLTWAFDRDIDQEYHLRRSALPSPGRVRELLELTSRMHGTSPAVGKPPCRGPQRRPIRGLHQDPPLPGRRSQRHADDAPGVVHRSRGP